MLGVLVMVLVVIVTLMVMRMAMKQASDGDCNGDVRNGLISMLPAGTFLQSRQAPFSFESFRCILSVPLPKSSHKAKQPGSKASN